MTGFISRELGDICDEVGGEIRTGPFGSQLHQSDYQDGGTPVVMPKDLGGDRITINGIARVGQEHVDRLSQHKLRLGDIVYGRRGDIGRRAIVTQREEGWLCGTGSLRISLGADNPLLNPLFLYYYLGQPHIIEGIYNQAVGATMPNLNSSIIRSIPVRYPPLSIQRRIAHVLSAYDDLIEVNRRRITALEAAAQALYREWFVEMRFPGHESAQWVESERGRIPAGWEATTVAEAFEITGGGTPSTKEPEYWDGDINWYVPSDLTAADTMFLDESGRKITEPGLQKSSARLFPAFSVMMTSRATLGVVAINTTEACTNQGFITCVVNERVSAYYLYFWIQENLAIINNLASGATFKEINKTNFRTIDILIPNKETHGSFLDLVEPMGQQILNLQRRNAALRETRDLLLPRLISGEVSVEGLPLPGEGE